MELISFPESSADKKNEELALGAYGLRLFSAVKDDEVDKMASILSSFPFLACARRGGRSLVDVALDSKSKACLAKLLSSPCFELSRDEGCEALAVAAKCGDPNLLASVLNSLENRWGPASLWIDTGESDSERRPILLIAAEGDNVDCVKLLLDKGADLKAVDGRGSTALMRAARGPSGQIFNLLLTLCDAKARNDNGDTALMLAVGNRNEPMVLAALPFSDLWARNKARMNALDLALRDKAFAMPAIESMAMAFSSCPSKPLLLMEWSRLSGVAMAVGREDAAAKLMDFAENLAMRMELADELPEPSTPVGKANSRRL